MNNESCAHPVLSSTVIYHNIIEIHIWLLILTHYRNTESDYYFWLKISAQRLPLFSASANSLGLDGTLIRPFNSSPVIPFNLLLTVSCCDSLHQRWIPFARVSLFHYPLLMILHAQLPLYIYYFNVTLNLLATRSLFSHSYGPFNHHWVLQRVSQALLFAGFDPKGSRHIN